MNDDRYRQLVRSGLAPFVLDAPDGPRWSAWELSGSELEPRPSKNRLPGWVVGVGAAAVVAGIVVTSLLFRNEDPSTATTLPPTTSVVPPDLAGAFVPPTRSFDGMTYLPLTLLDGSHITFAYPESLDLTSDGMEVQTVGTLAGDHIRPVGAHWGSPESFLAMIEASNGPGDLAATWQGNDGGVVERWEFPDYPIAYLVYDFDPWTVFVWDGLGNSSMGEDALEFWATSLWGETYPPGFLYLRALPPLELVAAGEEPRPDGPDIRVDGSSGSLLVFIDDCDRMTRLDEETYGGEGFAFCDEATNTLFFVGGSAEVQQRIHEELLVNPLPPGMSDDEAPLLDQATGTRVYLSTDHQLTVVDVDAGHALVHNLPELAPGDPLYRLSWRGHRLVFYGGTGSGAAVFVLDPAAPTSPILIDDRAWFYVPSAMEDRVWVAVLDESSPATVRALRAMREVSVDGVLTTADVAPPDGRWPVIAVDDGLVFQGDEILEVWDPDSQEFVHSLPGPFPVAAWGNRLVTCGICARVHLVDLNVDTMRTIDIPVGVAAIDGYRGAFSPDGRYVAVPGWLTGGPHTDETRLALVLIDFEAGTASLVPGIPAVYGYGHPQVAWSSGGEWLFYSVGPSASEAGLLFGYQPGDPTAFRVPVVLDAPYYGMAAD